MSTKKILPDYQATQQEISTHDPVSTAAELHGLICGIICASGPNAELPPHYQESAIMSALYPIIAEQFSHSLDQNTFTLELLLPADDQPLAVRTKAMSEWAQGFMAGLGEGGLAAIKANSDVEEVLNDFQQIAQLTINQDSEDEVTEQDEKAFAEIYEYMRMAVLNVYTDLVIAHNIEPQKNDNE